MRVLFVENARGGTVSIGEEFVNDKGEIDIRYAVLSDFTRAERKRLEALIKQIREPYFAEHGSCAALSPSLPRTPELRQQLEDLVNNREKRGVDFWHSFGPERLSEEEGIG